MVQDLGPLTLKSVQHLFFVTAQTCHYLQKIIVYFLKWWESEHSCTWCIQFNWLPCIVPWKYQKNKLIFFIERVVEILYNHGTFCISWLIINYVVFLAPNDHILLENFSQRDPILASSWLQSGWDPDLPEFLSTWMTVPSLQFMLFTRRTSTIVDFIIKRFMHCYIERLYFPPIIML